MLLITTFVELGVVAGRSRKRAGRPHAVSGRPMLIYTCHAMPRFAVALGSRFQNGIVAWHGRGVACVNQTRPHCVNQMGKTQSKPLAARHGRGMGSAWYVWISLQTNNTRYSHSSCKVHWGWRWSLATFTVSCNKCVTSVTQIGHLDINWNNKIKQCIFIYYHSQCFCICTVKPLYLPTNHNYTRVHVTFLSQWQILSSPKGYRFRRKGLSCWIILHHNNDSPMLYNSVFR
jgi:hypothetical protein